jgi:hypothetical protein
MTELFDVAPAPVLNFFENTASIMTTIPLKLIQSDLDEHEWHDL